MILIFCTTSVKEHKIKMATFEGRKVSRIIDVIRIEFHYASDYLRIGVPNFSIGKTVSLKEECEAIHIDKQVTEDESTAS